LREPRKDPYALSAATAVFTLLTVMLAFAALAVAGTALSNSKDAKNQAAAVTGTQVTLSEFSITPSMVDVAAGGVLTVNNAGTVSHNLAVEGSDLTTSTSRPGARRRSMCRA